MSKNKSHESDKNCVNLPSSVLKSDMVAAFAVLPWYPQEWD